MCALLAQAADHFYLEGGLRSALRISSSVDTISESVSNPARWLGIDAPYLLASMVMIGVSGFLSLGLLGPMLWPARGQQDTLLVVMIVVGLLRTFMLLYGAVKKRSGYFLREAEKMIVDVGESAPDPAPETTEATEATEADRTDEAGEEAGPWLCTVCSTVSPASSKRCSNERCCLQRRKFGVAQSGSGGEQLTIAQRGAARRRPWLNARSVDSVECGQGTVS